MIIDSDPVGRTQANIAPATAQDVGRKSYRCRLSIGAGHEADWNILEHVPIERIRIGQLPCRPGRGGFTQTQRDLVVIPKQSHAALRGQVLEMHEFVIRL